MVGVALFVAFVVFGLADGEQRLLLLAGGATVGYGVGLLYLGVRFVHWAWVQ